MVTQGSFVGLERLRAYLGGFGDGDGDASLRPGDFLWPTHRTFASSLGAKGNCPEPRPYNRDCFTLWCMAVAGCFSRW